MADERVERACSIWLCSAETRDECLNRSLFGDGQATDRWLSPTAEGDAAFLLDYERDELIGVFVVRSAMGAAIEPDAWGGRYPCQVRVEAVGAAVVLPRGASVLKAAGVPLRRLKGGGLVPRGFTFPATTTAALVRSFSGS